MTLSENIELIDIKKIVPYDKNPRNNKEAIPKVLESIKKFGFKDPIILDKNNVVIAGHTRLAAAKKLGLKELPCIYAKDLTDDEVRAFRLVNNKTSEYAQWETDLLNAEIEELRSKGMDLEEFGFTVEEKSISIDDIEEDKVPDLPKKAKCRQGEIYILGNHRLMVGDSTKAEDVWKLLNGTRVDCVVTDPPYNVAIGDKNKSLNKAVPGKGGQHEENLINDKMSDIQFVDFLSKAFVNLKDALKSGGVFYIWYSQTKSREFLKATSEALLNVHQYLIWVKNVFVIGRSDYQNIHETCLYGWKEGTSHYFTDRRNEKTVWEEEIPDVDQLTKEQMKTLLKTIYSDVKTDVIHEKKPQANKLHPTMKPVKLIARLIYNSTKRNQSVLDLFGGSGTTMIACEEMDRRCFMMEYDPKFADVIIERWENKTGRKAEKAER